MVTIREVQPVDDVYPDAVPEVGEIHFFSTDGRKYILDLDTVKTQEDIVTVLKHFSTRVELRVFEINGIEQYVKPITDTLVH